MSTIDAFGEIFLMQIMAGVFQLWATTPNYNPEIRTSAGRFALQGSVTKLTPVIEKTTNQKPDVSLTNNTIPETRWKADLAIHPKIQMMIKAYMSLLFVFLVSLLVFST